jgi:hypothetical protein
MNRKTPALTVANYRAMIYFAGSALASVKSAATAAGG